MLPYLGVKEINATPMTRGEYNAIRGWDLPDDENGEDEGYLVEYVDGGRANHSAYQGYVSWSPRDVFDRAYRPIHGMTFGLAIEALKQGRKVARHGWNGKGMWLSYVGRGQCDVDLSIVDPHNDIDKMLGMLPWIGMKTADEKFVPWLASQTDMLSEDWEIVK